jgi:hypothetical protein
MVGRGLQLWPLFLDRSYVSGFLDAGNAWCAAAERPRTTCSTTQDTPLVSVGLELGFNASLLSYSNSRLRIGVGQPLTNGMTPRFHVTFGPAF